MAKLLEVTVSGSYKTAGGDIVDFEDVKGVIPFVEEEYAKMHVRTRFASEWVRDLKNKDGEKVYKERIDHMRQVFIDEIEEIEGDALSYVGKDIKKMSYEELQDLACAKDLRIVPLPKATSGVDLREMRTKAYIAYAEKVQNNFISESDPDFDYANLPALVVDGTPRKETAKKITNEDIIDLEQNNSSTGSPKENLSLEDLKKVADERKIKYHWNIGRDKLYAMLYGGSSD